MRILHTADWHLGKTLYVKKRYEECQLFLDWLVEQIEKLSVEVVLLAGDVFDSSMPSHRSQSQYYEFLYRVSLTTQCRHVVVIAGNHDSPSLLDAPKALLSMMKIQVVGAAPQNIDDEVIELRDESGNVELIVAAVPYLRDRDLRTPEEGENISDKEAKLIQGLRAHYQQVAELAEQTRRKHSLDIPVIGMGHLYTAGGKTVEGDGVRELYVGSLAHVDSSLFSSSFDYVALGHLHVPQTVNGNELIRYSGSPIAMGFGESMQQKSCCLVDFNRRQAVVSLLEIPKFQNLATIRGDWEEIETALIKFKSEAASIWVEIIYQGNQIVPNLKQLVDEAVEGSGITVLRVKNTVFFQEVLTPLESDESVGDMNPIDVFERCLEANQIEECEREELMCHYREILKTVMEQDELAN